jgi:small GTP-binding protein
MAAFKATIVGESGVGKTTLSRLIRRQRVNVPRKPTVGVDIERVETDIGPCMIWDLAGQRRFRIMWDDFLRGSKLTILVTDSTAPNVMLTKDIIERHVNKTGARVIAIANKQDLDNRMSPSAIEAALGVPTFPMVAINKKNALKLQKIIEEYAQ